ncbi:MAG: T9SS type A sorting domain-containing protein [Bacteroidota bacterium]|nr:T9SS type A sorting domain-containing protein [Bacteroidota bacterium]
MKKNTINVILCLFLGLLSTDSTAQFTNSGNVKIHSGASLSFFGDVTNNSSFIDSGLVVNMNGSLPQTIDGSSVISFNNLVIKNTHSAGITLAQDVNIKGVLTMNTGVLFTTAINILQVNNSATTTGASNSSFVSGPVCKTGNQPFVFPVGKNLVYAPIAISTPGLSTDQFIAEYFQTNPDAFYNVNSKDLSLDHVSVCEYWNLDKITGTSDVTVNLSWDTRSCGMTNLSEARVARWDGTQWKDHGNGGTSGSVSAGTIVSASSLSSFGPFTLASSSVSNPLPIELSSFTGSCSGGNITLEWTTATETNNDYFTVERSIDGLSWTTIQTVAGAGNSTSTLNYRFTDTQAYDEVLYYRLNQTDWNGLVKYYDVIMVTPCNDIFGNDLSIYPNPSTGNFNFVFNGDIHNVISIEIMNVLGERIYSGLPIDVVSLSDQPIGIYFFHLNLYSESIIQKIVIVK